LLVKIGEVKFFEVGLCLAELAVVLEGSGVGDVGLLLCGKGEISGYL
jgi:hypothetical protein